MSNSPPSSRDERRILREVRRRYDVRGNSRPRRKARFVASQTQRRRARTGGTRAVTSPNRARGKPRPARVQAPVRKLRGRDSLLRQREQIAPDRRRKTKGRWIRRIFTILFLVLLVGGGIFGYKILATGNQISVAEQSILGQLKDLLLGSGEYLRGEQEGRINMLLIAIGGKGHKGRDLADTIMVASIRPQDNSVALLSIPRDLYVQVPEEEYFAKINAVHAYGESKKKDSGPRVLVDKVEEITGLPIHYYGRIDFTAFKSIVDTVGGITITIDNSFYDYWHKISFPAGTEKMNGERALAYVRARFIEGPEGGDFKRAKRQQQVLLALRDKVFSVQTAFDFITVNTILDSLSDNIRTDMQLWEMRRFFEMARMIDPGDVRSVVLSSGPDGVLVGGTEMLRGAPASVLRPRTGDYSEIHAIAQNIFSDTVSSTLQPTAQATPVVKEEASDGDVAEREQVLPSLDIRNGTNITGLAKRVSNNMKNKGYEVHNIGNAHNRSVSTTTAYALSDDAIEAVKGVGETLGAETDSGLPKGEKESEADILIILGTDAENWN